MKLLHSIRFRFALSFCLFVFALCAVTSIIAMYQTSRTVSRFFIEQGVFMTEEAASLIDGDAFERLLSTMDAEDPFYEKTRIELLTVKNYSTAKYLYTMGPVNGDTSLFIIDGSVPPGDEEFSALGDESDVSGYDPAFMKCWKTRRTEYSNMTYQEDWGWLIITIKDKSRVLSGVGNELASSVEQTAAAINQITANTRNIKSKVMHQAAGITETNATMEQVTVNIDRLNGHVEQQTDSVSRSSSAIEEMLANIQSVTRTLIRNTENVTELIEASETGRSGLEKVSQDIREIAKQSEIINSINEMALSADQINGAVSRINGISASNRENTNDLAVEVSKFKVQ
ncbi:MAG: methyl-accepting chemotaxis protein [Treponema sp.]|nr:methyl-accepting chemotaxis protein [Treponema sp.]